MAHHQYERRNQPEPWRVKGARFTRWLTSRPAESWGFFAAGFLICAILT